MNEKLIEGIRTGLAALRDANVEPMGLSLSAHDGSFGWGFFKFKALPGHPNPGNAGHGWSHPTDVEAFKFSHAPRDWPQGGSFPWDWQTTLDDVKSFALEIGRLTGFGTDFTLECAWRNYEDMTVPGQIGILSDMNLLRGGAEHYAYYPDSIDEISYVDNSGDPIDPVKEDKVRNKFRSLKAAEQADTDEYMKLPETDHPMTISGAWYIDAVPGAIIAELPDGTLEMFAISPFRVVKLDNMQPYSGQHPRKLRGVPVPSNLYAYYGLTKSEETLSEVLRVRLSPSELEKLKAAADASGKTTSEFAREWVRGL
jgi:hypothetical protein